MSNGTTTVIKITFFCLLNLVSDTIVPCQGDSYIGDTFLWDLILSKVSTIMNREKLIHQNSMCLGEVDI